MDIILEKPADKYRGLSEFVSDVITKSRQVYKNMLKNRTGVIKRNTNLYSGRKRKWVPSHLCGIGETPEPIVWTIYNPEGNC